MKSSDVEKARGNSLSFAVDEKRMARNARDSANTVDWKSTKLHSPQGGRQLGIDPVRLVTDQIKRDHRQIAFDMAAELKADRLHQLLDELIEEGEEEEEPSSSDSDEPPEEESAAAFSMDELLRQLAAIADDEPRSVGKDTAPRKVCCFDCGTLAARQINEEVRASRARLI
jgi:hypothetical protein